MDMRKNRIIWLLFVVMLVVCLLDSAIAADKNKERITGNDVKNDFQQFYSRNRLRQMGIAFGGGAVMANISIDENLQNWYQSHIRNSDTDEFAKAAKVFGERIYLIPLFFAVSSAEYYFYVDKKPSVITDTIWDRDKEERKVTIIPSISHDRYGIRICLKW